MAGFHDDDASLVPAAVHVIGQDLSTLSIFELEQRATLLKEEILRIETAMSSKHAQRDQADRVFGSR